MDKVEWEIMIGKVFDDVGHMKIKWMLDRKANLQDSDGIFSCYTLERMEGRKKILKRRKGGTGVG